MFDIEMTSGWLAVTLDVLKLLAIVPFRRKMRALSIILLPEASVEVLCMSYALKLLANASFLLPEASVEVLCMSCALKLAANASFLKAFPLCTTMQKIETKRSAAILCTARIRNAKGFPRLHQFTHEWVRLEIA